MRIFRFIVWAIGSVLTVYLIWVATFAFSPAIREFNNRIEFDSERWKAWEESEKELSLRWNMVSDLTSDYDLTGMTVQEVKDLLGEPDRTSKNNFSYYLGLLGIDTGTLSLTIKNGVVTGYKVYRG